MGNEMTTTGYQAIPVTTPAVTIKDASLPAGGAETPGTAANILNRQQTMAEGAQWSNVVGQFANLGLEAYKTHLQGSLMNRMIDFSVTQMEKYYGLQESLVGLNGNLISSQEKVALKQLTTTKEIAELQKEKDVAIAKTRADAAVKIAKVNALSTQFYGQPTANKLPSISA